MEFKKIVFAALLAFGISFLSEFIPQSYAVNLQTFENQPLFLMKNNGQVDEKVKFYEKGANHATFLADDDICMSLIRQQKISGSDHFSMDRSSPVLFNDTLKLSFINANEKPEIVAENSEGPIAPTDRDQQTIQSGGICS